MGSEMCIRDSPYSTRSFNDSGSIKTIVQPAHCTPSRYASYGSAILQRHATGSLAHGVLSYSAPPLCFGDPLPPLTIAFSSLEYLFSFGFSLFLLRLLFFRLWFFELAFHLVLSLVRANIRVIVLVFYSKVPTIGLDRLVFVHGPQTCRVSNFCFFCQFGIASRRYLSYSRPRNCRFPPSAVFRSSLTRIS